MLVHKGGKIKNRVESAEMSHLQNCSVKIFKEHSRYFTKKKMIKIINEKKKIIRKKKKNLL